MRHAEARHTCLDCNTRQNVVRRASEWFSLKYRLQADSVCSASDRTEPVFFSSVTRLHCYACLASACLAHIFVLMWMQLYTYVGGWEEGMSYQLRTAQMSSHVRTVLMFRFLWMTVGRDSGHESTTFFTLVQRNVIHIILSPFAERSTLTCSRDLEEHFRV